MLRFLRKLLPIGSTQPSARHSVLERQAPDTSPAAKPAPQDDPASDAMGARRLLISKDGKIVGFEFHLNSKLQERVAHSTHAGIQASYIAVLLASARRVAESGRMGLARIPLHWLKGLGDAPIAPGMWIAIEASTTDMPGFEAPWNLQASLARLQAHGAKIGWAHGVDLPAQADFVLMQPEAHSIARQIEARKAWPADQKALPVLAIDLRNIHEAQYALTHGVDYVCGPLMSQLQPETSQDTHALPPVAKRISQIIALLVRNADTAKVVDLIKGDVGLSLRVLQRANSAIYSNTQSNTSIEQAIAVLGRKQLHRWMSTLLLQYGDSGRVQSALQVIALWRSRHLELLAMERSNPAPEALFMLGLASMLVPLLKISRLQVSEMLALGESARLALLESRGPLAPYLELVQSHEADTLHDNTELAALFGGVPTVKALSAQAWAWAEAHGVDN